MEQNLTGAQVARMSWQIPAGALAALLPGTGPDGLDDVRAQLAMWATTLPAGTAFASLADAWNAFVAPRAGQPGPAALLPGAACQACARARRSDRDLARATRPGYPACPACRGTGRKPPRALPAALATAALDTALDAAQATATG